MKKVNSLKYGLTALMIAVAMTLCYSCSNKINGHAYVELAGYKWATENVGEVKGLKAVATDSIYGCYYTQSNATKAAKSWGYKWMLPTKAQWKALIDSCDWTLTTQNHKECYKVSDKKDSSKFIFLPADGFATFAVMSLARSVTVSIGPQIMKGLSTSTMAALA